MFWLILSLVSIWIYIKLKRKEEEKEEKNTAVCLSNKAEKFLLQQEKLVEKDCDCPPKNSSGVTSTIRIAMGDIASLQEDQCSSLLPVTIDDTKPHLELQSSEITSAESKSDRVNSEQTLVNVCRELNVSKESLVSSGHAAALVPAKLSSIKSSSGESTVGQFHNNAQLPKAYTSLTFNHQLLERCEKDNLCSYDGEDQVSKENVLKNTVLDGQFEGHKSMITDKNISSPTVKSNTIISAPSVVDDDSAFVQNPKYNLNLQIRCENNYNDKYPKMNNYEVIRRRSQNSRSSFSSIIEKSREELDKSDESFEEICWEIERTKAPYTSHNDENSNKNNKSSYSLFR